MAGNHEIYVSRLIRTCVLLALMVPPVGCSGSGDFGRVDPGDLSIRIVSPSAEATYVSSEANVPFGGSVGGWSIIDPAPTILWTNQTTGSSGQIGQLLGTWSVDGGVNLQQGANVLTVRASNGVQKDAFDSMTVIFEPPPR